MNNTNNYFKNYGIIYLDIRELVNKKKYMLHGVPCSYTPVESYFISKDSPGPLYTPLKGEVGTGMFTIATMIDMYFNKVDFVFDSTDQMREVEKYLGTYLATIEQDLKYMNREQKEYINRAKDFYKFLCKKVDYLEYLDKKKREEKEKRHNPFLSEVKKYTIRR